MNNVYPGLPLQTLPPAGAFVFSSPIDTTYMVMMTLFIDFAQAGGAGNPIMIIESSPDGGVTWKKLTTFGAVAGTGPITIVIGDAEWVYPAKSDSYATPLNVLGHFLIRVGFAMQNGLILPGDISFQYGVQLRTPP